MLTLKKVILPKRIKSDLLDGFISSVIIFAPAFAVYAFADYISQPFHRMSIIGIPIGALYLLFRDSFGGGTSLGKRVLGLVVIDLRSGQRCDGSRVLTRNVLDLIPIIDLIDFVLTCLDPRGQKIMDKVLGTQVTESEFLRRADVEPALQTGTL
jgi:uncharacterized RDD family membrane protein YckC